MADLNEQTIVISDLLSVLSCKVKSTSKEKLLRAFREYYSDSDISEAQKTLLASIPVKKSTRHGRRVKHPDPLVAIYDCFQLIPSEDLPVFVCKDLDNIPEFDIVKSEPIDEYDDEIAVSDTEKSDDEIDPSLISEQNLLKSQISDIALVVQQLKDELHSLTGRDGRNSVNVKRKESTIPPSSNKRKSTLINTKVDSAEPKKGLAFLQKLIDEDEKKSETEEDVDIAFDEDEDSQFSLIEYEGDINTDDTEISFDNQSSNSFQIGHKKGIKSSKSRDSERKVIFIKNEDENSIEIASSDDYFTGFHDDDQLNMILEWSNEDQDFKGEIELMVNDVKDSSLSKDSGVLRSCSICGDLFSTQKKLDIHVKTHCVKKIFDCILCDEGFLSKEQLRSHFEQCLEVTKKKYNLDAFPCPTCGRLYAQERALKQHSYMHSESRPFGCSQCTYRYLTKNSLDAHIKTQHNAMNKFFCPFCDNSYISVGFLKNHIRSHTGERPFACKECGYRASTGDLLKRHMLTHGPPKEFKCDACDFTCIGIGKLSRHKAREHKRENIFCTICGKEFNNSCVYHKHYMSHVGARPFPCTVCSYAAISKEVLMVHMRTHTGDNIINCPNCSVPFGTKYSLKRHLKNYCINRSSYYNSEYVVQ